MNPRKPKIYQEEVKTRHTSHWDWDYLPTEELEAAVEEGNFNQHETRNQRAKQTSFFASLWSRIRNLFTNRG